MVKIGSRRVREKGKRNIEEQGEEEQKGDIEMVRIRERTRKIDMRIQKILILWE